MHSPSSTAGPRASLRATALAALAVSTSLLLHALPVQAAEPAASAAARSYQIQPGPLGPALMAFAAQAGVNLGMDLQQLGGMETRGLSGTFSVEDGFAQLLNTSGWTARRVGAGNYALEKLPAAARQAPSTAAAVPSPSAPAAAPAAAQATELAAITVTARTQ
ncbi:MAG TPA: TonB-dependent siderophore receptor, partial [Delftia acidovorans]|nr:TonB-dependent siderophore receptor [Delftia acidovorans]